MKFVIDGESIYSNKVDLEGLDNNVSPFLWISHEYNDHKKIYYINKLESNNYLEKATSIQQLIVEENKAILLKIIAKINKKYPSVSEIIIKEVPCISDAFNRELKKLNIIVESNQFIDGYKRDKLDLYYFGIKKLVTCILENNKEQIGNLKEEEKERIAKYLKIKAPSLLGSIRKKVDTQVILKCINNENAIQEVKLCLSSKDLMTYTRISEKDLSGKDYYEMQEKYKVVMISPFSYGKSTLINALLGKEILGADIRAETANITKMIWGTERKVFLEYNANGKGIYKEKKYKTDEELSHILRELTSVREEGNNLNQISILGEFGIDKDITFIDSPGLFSRYEHHDHLSRQALYQGDLIIFVFDPESIGDSNFSKIIESYREYIITQRKDVCFVITKRDMYDKEEEQKVIKEIQIVLRELGFGNEDIIFVSAYMALKCQMYEQGYIEFDQIRKDRIMFVEENGEIIRGKALEEHHIPVIMEYSNLNKLKERILSSKENYL